MAFKTGLLAGDAYASLRSNASQWKAQTQNALTFMQSNNIDTIFAYTLIDNLRAAIVSIANMVAVAGLDTFATGQGYSGSMVADANAISSAASACITAIATSFPKDAGGFAQDFTLNADGSRTPRTFTPAQTSAAGIQSSLTSLIATIQ